MALHKKIAGGIKSVGRTVSRPVRKQVRSVVRGTGPVRRLAKRANPVRGFVNVTRTLRRQTRRAQQAKRRRPSRR